MSPFTTADCCCLQSLNIPITINLSFLLVSFFVGVSVTTLNLSFVAVYVDVTSGSSQPSTACFQDVSYFNNHKTLQLAFTYFVCHTCKFVGK